MVAGNGASSQHPRSFRIKHMIHGPVSCWVVTIGGMLQWREANVVGFGAVEHLPSVMLHAKGRGSGLCLYRTCTAKHLCEAIWEPVSRGLKLVGKPCLPGVARLATVRQRRRHQRSVLPGCRCGALCQGLAFLVSQGRVAYLTCALSFAGLCAQCSLAAGILSNRAPKEVMFGMRGFCRMRAGLS